MVEHLNKSNAPINNDALLRQQPRRGRLTGSDTVPLVSQRSNHQLSSTSTSYYHTHHDNRMPRSKDGMSKPRARSLPDVLEFEELMSETSSAVEKRQIKVDEKKSRYRAMTHLKEELDKNKTQSPYIEQQLPASQLNNNKMQRSRSADAILDFILAEEFAEDALDRQKQKKWHPKRHSSAAPPSRMMTQRRGSKQRIVVPMDYTLDSSQRPGVDNNNTSNNSFTYSPLSMKQARVLKMTRQRQNSLLEVEPRRSRPSLNTMRSLPDVLNFEEVKKEQTKQSIQQQQHKQKISRRRFRSRSADMISDYGRWDDDMIDLEKDDDKNPQQTHQRRNKSFKSQIRVGVFQPSTSVASKQAVNDILPIVQNTGSSKHNGDMSRSGGSRRSDVSARSLPDVLDFEEMMQKNKQNKSISNVQHQQPQMKHCLFIHI